MKVVACVRTLNEEAHIGRFCEAYSQVADLILVSDGGSEDKTLEIASGFEKVVIHTFEEKIFSSYYWRNPEGEHRNQVVHDALHFDPDWIILDDCDSVPNYQLQHILNRGHLLHQHQDLPTDVINVPRMYLWGADQWFPELSGQPTERKPVPRKGDWTAPWAWKPRADLRWKENNGWNVDMCNPQLEGLEVYRMQFPAALLHYFCLTPEIVAKKMEFYKGSGQIPNMVHPLESCGPLQALPEWARP